jgi:hypothetical protein
VTFLFQVNASDLNQLLSRQGDGDVSENVMAMLLELQTTVKALEGGKQLSSMMQGVLTVCAWFGCL